MENRGYLFDTHVLLWHLAGDERLPQNIRELIENPTATKYISIASAWEVAIKISIGKLSYGGGAKNFWGDIMNGGFKELPLAISAIDVLESLEYHHKDPFDRIIVASAVSENLLLVTGDEIFKGYSVDILWR